MFEPELLSRFKQIFDFPKTSFQDPGESLEQEHLFIEVEQANANISDVRQVYKVTGQAYVHVQGDKLPFGYFAKRIAAAPLELTANLFFSSIDDSTKLYGNIVRRSFDFVFLFESQYDPRKGTITSVILQEGES